jgi:hypothetical protein
MGLKNLICLARIRHDDQMIRSRLNIYTLLTELIRSVLEDTPRSRFFSACSFARYVYHISVAMTQSVNSGTFVNRPVNNKTGVRMRGN